MLHVAERKRTPKQRIVAEVNLADREVVRLPPVSVDLVKQFGSEDGGDGFHWSESGIAWLRPPKLLPPTSKRQKPMPLTANNRAHSQFQPWVKVQQLNFLR
jgi:hypothetical protein